MAQLYHSPVLCTICENPVEYHCNTCGDVLCGKCRDNHLKSNAAKHHDVVLYSQRIKPTTSALQCGDHPGHQCDVWCQTCDRAACGYCVTSSKHRCHHFLKFDEKIKERRKEIQNYFHEYTEILSDWQTALREAQNTQEMYEKDIKNTDGEIVTRADDICKQVRAVETEKRKQLQDMKDASIHALRHQQELLIDGIGRMETKVKDLDETLRTNDLSTILQYPTEKVNRTDVKPYPSKPPEHPDFIVGEIDANLVKEMFGSLSKRSEGVATPKPAQGKPEMSLETKPVEESILNIEKDFFYPTVVCVGTDHAWVQTAVRKLQLVNRHGEVKNTVNLGFNIRLYDMSLSSDGNILLPDVDNKSIRIMSKEGEIKTFFRTGWNPDGICCLSNGHIVVTFKWNKKVVRYSSTGKIMSQMDSTLFQYPWNVAQNKVNQHLYICDKSKPDLYEALGQILVTDIYGEKLYSYTGSDAQTFAPLAVCTSQAGQVLITDSLYCIIHILDKDGTFLTYLQTHEEEQATLITIDVDSEGYAWIGELETGKMRMVKYID